MLVRVDASYGILGVGPRLPEVLPRRVGPFKRSPAVVDAARRLGVALGVAVRRVSGVVEDLDAVRVECGDGVDQCARLQQHAVHGCESCTLAATLAAPPCGVLALAAAPQRIDVKLDCTNRTNAPRGARPELFAACNRASVL